jgi:hypothetical protein
MKPYILFQIQFSYLLLFFFLSWRLRHCATSRKVTGSRLDEVNAFFQCTIFSPLGLTMPLGFTQPLAEN